MRFRSRLDTIVLALFICSMLFAPARVMGKTRVDIEIDPTAFIFNGYSLHAGIWMANWRVDLGAFAMDVPEAFHGNEDFKNAFNGYGLKLQYFPLREMSGGFIGIDAAIVKFLLESAQSNAASYLNTYTLGVNTGWRFNFGKHFHMTPWVGVGYNFNSKDVVLDGNKFKATRFGVFPAIHIGRTF